MSESKVQAIRVFLPGFSYWSMALVRAWGQARGLKLAWAKRHYSTEGNTVGDFTKWEACYLINAPSWIR